MASQEEYKVQLEVFEGPLDLLLYLIKKDELDIYDIPIERITTQYMQYMDLMRMLDLNIAGEFIVMAATLMMIKSRMLLPPEERAALEEEEEEDPRWDLVRQLVEYKKFKDAAMHLEGLEERQADVFGRGSDAATLGPAGLATAKRRRRCLKSCGRTSSPSESGAQNSPPTRNSSHRCCETGRSVRAPRRSRR